MSLTMSKVSAGPIPLQEGANKDENPRTPSSCVYTMSDNRLFILLK